MFVKNLLHAGDLLSLIPIGLPVTLQYDDRGKLQKIFSGYSESGVDISARVLESVKVSKLVPASISVKNGTSFVKGVFYTPHVFHVSGNLPDCISNAVISLIIANKDVTFYAGDITSFAMAFRGGSSTRQWLKTAGFNVLPAYLVPADLTESKFVVTAYRDLPYAHNIFIGYMIWRGGTCQPHMLGMMCHTVQEVLMSVTDAGFIRGRVDDVVEVPWSTIVANDIQHDSVLILDAHKNVQDCINNSVDIAEARSGLKLKPVAVTSLIGMTMKCPVCHKMISVPKSGPVRCDDPKCSSRMYPSVLQFLDALQLPVISRSRYLEMAEEIGPTFDVLDLFEFPEYESADPAATISDLISAVVPSSVCSNHQMFDTFASQCKQSVATAEYYLTHPDRILRDLSLDAYQHDVEAWARWLEHPENAIDITNLFHHPNIHVIAPVQKLEVMPILRNHLLYLTGKFRHGAVSEVAAFLEKYAAKITDTLHADTTCVIVGDLHEEADARAIQSAQNAGIPIMTESAFYSYYDIDSEIPEDL